MPAFVADLPAAAVDSALCESLRELRAAEKNAVLYFAEAMNRRLYRELGYATMHQYATERLHFSRSKTGYFIQLATAMKQLPRVRASVALGELPWTKAIEVVKVATPRTEKRWLRVAKESGRRELVKKVRIARRAAAGGKPSDDLFAAGEARRENTAASHAGPPVVETGNPPAPGNPRAASRAPGLGTAPIGLEPPSVATSASQVGVRTTRVGANSAAVGAGATPVLGGSAPVGVGSARVGTNSKPGRAIAVTPDPLPPAATDVRIRLRADQRARFEAMLEKLRKLGEKADRAEFLLEAMTLLVLDRTQARRCSKPAASQTAEMSSRLDSGNVPSPNAFADSTPRVQRPRYVPPIYQVYVRTCEQCERGWLETDAGPELIDLATLRAILCDARVSRPGEPNRHEIPPMLRRQALDRDHHRCRARGCGSHRFLNVHHLHAKEDGGPHRLENLITLCSACHKMAHAVLAREAELWTTAA